MIKTKSKNFSATVSYNFVLLFCIGCGILLVCYQFFQDRGVWGDEVVYAANIVEKSFLEFFYPLDYYVAAPVGFMFFEKISILLFGVQDITLRIFPFVATLIGLFFNWKVLILFFKNKYVHYLCFSLLVLSPALIYYSSEIKPYAIEFFLTTVLLYAFFQKKRNYYLLGILGFLFIFLGNNIVLVLFCIGLNYLFTTFAKRQIPSFPICFMLCSWLLGVVLFYKYFVQVHAGANAWHSDWLFIQGGFLLSDYYHFNPLRMALGVLEIFASDTGFIYDQSYPFVRSLVVQNKLDFYSLSDVLKVIPIGKLWYFILFLTGFFHILRFKNAKLKFLLCGPILIHFFLMFLEIYPIGIRIMVYLLPIIFIIIGIGFRFILNKIPNFQNQLKLFNVICIVILTFNMIQHSPIIPDYTKDAFTKLVQIKKESPEIHFTLVSYQTMINHYQKQPLFKELLKNVDLHQIRKYPISSNKITERQWFFIAPQNKDQAISDLTLRWEILESHDEIGLYKVQKLNSVDQ